MKIWQAALIASPLIPMFGTFVLSYIEKCPYTKRQILEIYGPVITLAWTFISCTLSTLFIGD